MISPQLTNYVIVMFGILLFLIVFLVFYREKKFRERMEALTAGTAELTSADFLETAQARSGQDFTGCYILHNVTKDKYYVGQGKSVLQRVKQHLTGHGNGDVYADYKFGDTFTVKTISLAQSGYNSLNALERDLIASHNAYTKGYNRTRGNRN